MSGSSALNKRVLRIDAVAMAAVAALLGAGYFVGVEPVLNARARVEEKRRDIDEQVRTASESEQLINIEQNKLAAIRRLFDSTSVQLSPLADINRRLAVISELADRHHVRIDSLNPGTEKSDPAIGQFTTVPIRLAGGGGFVQVSDFLHELLSEKYPDIEVRGLSMSAPAADAEPDKAAFAIELRWYAAPAASADAQPRP